MRYNLNNIFTLSDLLPLSNQINISIEYNRSDYPFNIEDSTKKALCDNFNNELYSQMVFSENKVDDYSKRKCK